MRYRHAGPSSASFRGPDAILLFEHQFEYEGWSVEGETGVDDWFGLFANSVWRYLDGIGARASADGSPSGAELRKLAGAWRALLRLHGTDPDGSCLACRRAHAGVCSVWQVAIGYFVRRPPS